MQDLHVQETQKISPVRELWFALSCLVSLVPSLRCANLLDRDGFSTTGLLARLPKLLRCWEQRQNVVLQVWTNLQKISCRYAIRLQSSVYTQFQFAAHSPSAQQLSRSKNEYWMHFHFKWWFIFLVSPGGPAITNNWISEQFEYSRVVIFSDAMNLTGFYRPLSVTHQTHQTDRPSSSL